MVRSPWVAVEATTDRRQHARELSRAHRHAMEGQRQDRCVRDVIRESWGRSAAAGVDPEVCSAPVRFSGEEASARLEKSQLALAIPVLKQLREDVRAEDEQIALLCDPNGTILWIEGDPRVLDRAQEIHLSPGAEWSEAAVGTNAMGTALALDHPVQIFSAEHFAEPVHEWTCAAAPLHDPDTGERVGVIDLSGGLSTAHPHSLALVASAARMIEAMAFRERREREAHAKESPRPSALVRPKRSAAKPIEVQALGRDRAEVTIGSKTITLSRRHSEILLALSLRPDGMNAEQLALAVWGEQAKPVSARAEISRLKCLLGSHLEADPYRLRGTLRSDADETRALIGQGLLSNALESYAGPLLPRSEVPLIVEARQLLDDEMRDALRAGGDPALLDRWLTHPAGEDDVVVCRELLGLLPEGDGRRHAALSHLRRITAAGSAR